MVAIDENGGTVEVPGLVLSSKIEAKRFIKTIIRRNSEAKIEFDESEVYKNVHNHLELLKDYRVKVNIK
jgi:hypothetical protein